MQSLRSRSSTRRLDSALKLLCAITFAMWIAAMLTGCGTLSTRPSADGPSPLVQASCPQLTPLSDDTFAATSLKLIEVAGIYHECRAAALAGKPDAGPADYSLKPDPKWPR